MDSLEEKIAAARAAYDAMSPVDKAIHDADQKRSFVRGQCGTDPGEDVLAAEVRRLHALLAPTSDAADLVERLRTRLHREIPRDWEEEDHDLVEEAAALITAQAAEIEVLKVVKHAMGPLSRAALVARADAAEAALDVARTALGPFAAYSDGIGHFGGPNSPFWMGWESNKLGRREITEDDFRRAAEAYKLVGGGD